MPTWAWIVIAVVAALIVIGAIAAWMQQRRRTELKERFGSGQYMFLGKKIDVMQR